MSKITTDIFELDSDIKLEGKNDFAKNYESWRKKEELNKRKIVIINQFIFIT